MPRTIQRSRCAGQVAEILDGQLFRALCEPARVEILRLLIAGGRSDLGSLAEGVPQDLSVVSRHLSVLCDAGVVRREKKGRHVHFEVDGPAVVERFQKILDRLRQLVPLCCPAASRMEES